MTIRKCFFVLATLLALVCMSQATQAATISVNPDWGSGQFLAPGDVAGVVAAANWNNVDVSAGASLPAGDKEGVILGLLDSSGAATGVNFRTYGSGPNGADSVNGGTAGDQLMMNNGVRTSIEGHQPNSTVGQLEFTNLLGTFSSYDVYLYIGEGHPLMGSAGQAGTPSNLASPSTNSGIVVSGAGTYTNAAGGTGENDVPAGTIIPYMTRAIASGGFNFDTTYNISTGFSDEGNYVKISGLQLDTLVLSPVVGTNTANDKGGGFFETFVTLGVQIDGQPVPEPSSFVLAGLALVGLAGFAVRRRKK